MMNLARIRILADGASPGIPATLKTPGVVKMVAELVAEIDRLRGIVVDTRDRLSTLLEDLTWPDEPRNSC